MLILINPPAIPTVAHRTTASRRPTNFLATTCILFKTTHIDAQNTTVRIRYHPDGHCSRSTSPVDRHSHQSSSSRQCGSSSPPLDRQHLSYHAETDHRSDHRYNSFNIHASHQRSRDRQSRSYSPRIEGDIRHTDASRSRSPPLSLTTSLPQQIIFTSTFSISCFDCSLRPQYNPDIAHGHATDNWTARVRTGSTYWDRAFNRLLQLLHISTQSCLANPCRTRISRIHVYLSLPPMRSMLSSTPTPRSR